MHVHCSVMLTHLWRHNFGIHGVSNNQPECMCMLNQFFLLTLLHYCSGPSISLRVPSVHLVATCFGPYIGLYTAIISCNCLLALCSRTCTSSCTSMTSLTTSPSSTNIGSGLVSRLHLPEVAYVTDDGGGIKLIIVLCREGDTYGLGSTNHNLPLMDQSIT